jgi:predicted dehydrogenase
MSEFSEAASSRRSFLAGTVSAAAMAATSSLLPRAARAQSTEPQKKLGFAIVGIGRLSVNQLLPAFAHCQHARLAALVSGDSDKAKKFASQYQLDEKHIYSYADFEQIAHDDSIDVAYIVLPNGMHAQFTIRAAKAGKHVFCEKPMANTVDECKQMIDACRAANRVLAIGYRMQYEPYTQFATDLCRRQVQGRARLITADHGFNIGPGTWRTDAKLAGGGALMDVGIYCLNAARMLMGAEPVEVSAQMDQPKNDPRFKEVEASMAFTLKFPSGALAACTTTYDGAGGSRLRVMSDSGEIFLEPSFSYNAPKMWIKERGQLQQAVRPSVDQFATEMDEFARNILNNQPQRTPGEEGLADMRAIEALYKSAREGKTIQLAQ